jgi:hypothetical protein
MDIKGRKRIGWRSMAGRTQGHLDTASSTRVRNLLERSTAQASLTRLPMLRILVLSTARSVLYSGQGVHSRCIPLSVIGLSFFSACGDRSAGSRPVLKFNAKPALEGVPKSRNWEFPSDYGETIRACRLIATYAVECRRQIHGKIYIRTSNGVVKQRYGIVVFCSACAPRERRLRFRFRQLYRVTARNWIGSMPHGLSGDTPNRRTCAQPIRSA